MWHLCGHYEVCSTDERAHAVERSSCYVCHADGFDDSAFVALQREVAAELRHELRPAVEDRVREHMASFDWPTPEFASLVFDVASRSWLNSAARRTVWGLAEKPTEALDIIRRAHDLTRHAEGVFTFRGPYKFGPYATWLKGLGYLLGVSVTKTPVRTSKLIAKLNQRLPAVVPETYDYRQPVTKALTDEVRTVLSGMDGLRAYREVCLPVSSPRPDSALGRADLIGMGGYVQDVVVEIDSEPNPASISKLLFAAKVGALPIWVRWHTFETEQPDGVLLINLASPDTAPEPEIAPPPDEN